MTDQRGTCRHCGEPIARREWRVGTRPGPVMGRWWHSKGWFTNCRDWTTGIYLQTKAEPR